MNIPIESLNLMTLNVGFARHHADWNWQGVSSPFTRIFLVTEGRAWLHLPEGKIELRPGYAYIVPAYTTHSYQCDGDFALYYLHIHEGFKNVTDVFDTYEFPTEVKADAIYEALFASACRAYPDAGLPASNPISYDNDSRLYAYVDKYSSLALHERMSLRGFTLMLVARFLAEAGFARVILERSLSLEEIRTICTQTSAEVECFVHGAICVGYSGRCFLSRSMSPTRSGNRGGCSQPCRLKWTLTDGRGRTIVADKHLLSLQDLCLYNRLGELLDAGVTSFNIEGRL